MRNRRLHDALRGFALEAAKLLRDDQLAGHELEFDLDEGNGGDAGVGRWGRRGHGGPTLYHYRPLTDRFIAERWTRLRMLESRPSASEALGAGAAAYLRVNGMHGGESEPALQAMLERLYEDMSDFTFPEERFERVYGEVERTLYERSQPATILVPLHGVELEAERVELGEGVAIVRGDRTDAPDEAVWGDPAGDGAGDEAGDAARDAAGAERREPNTLLVLAREIAPEDGLPLAEARARFAELLTGMRLWKPGGVALSPLAWRRTGDGRWQPFELDSTGVARGEPWALQAGEEAELSEFLAAIEGGGASGAAHGGGTAWALRRFELGCGRPHESEALSDYLLGLRALLDVGPQTGRASLASRIAVLCASDGERKRVQRRIELAQALERFVMGDGPDDEYLDAVGADSPRTLVDEAERHLRALLRDVLCGYLDPDLRRVADDLLLEPPEPFEIHARSLRDGPATAVARGEAVQEEAVQEEIAVEQQTEEQDQLEDPAFWSAPV